MQQSSTAITKNGKITERFIRYSDTEIVYRFTVEDSDLYSQPWTAELSFHATDGQLYEYACHEGNYSMPGTLAGARRQEAEKNRGQLSHQPTRERERGMGRFKSMQQAQWFLDAMRLFTH
jgi:hypothetical protein